MKKKLIKIASVILIIIMLAGILMPIAATAAGTWMQAPGGRWWFQNADSTYARGWQQIGGVWYFFDSSGWMQTGWVQSGGLWYFLRPSGAMATGWVQTGGLWYWLHPQTGAMVTGSAEIGGVLHTFAADGRWLGGGGQVAPAPGPAPGPGQGVAGQGVWRLTSGRWWFEFAAGGYARGWQQIGGVWYFFDSSGWMQTGWVHTGGLWYFLRPSGAMATGWLEVGGWWYWLHPQTGAMATGTINIGGVSHSFAADGRWLGGGTPGVPGPMAPSLPASLVGSWGNAYAVSAPTRYVLRADGTGTITLAAQDTAVRWWVRDTIVLVICTRPTACGDGCAATHSEFIFSFHEGALFLSPVGGGTTVSYVRVP
ncbi:MAG: hypothetical protein FWC20_04720 [Oscillospiraceae bacterium]|nr:hypothetical protein [Oscillospiraceae bacterium]MCL2278697.1 hypothetical protein [Oscillospiraceae bacterium]